MTNREIFRRNLKNLMYRQNVTAIDLAKRIDSPYITVNGWTRGVSYPRPETMEKIAKAFNVPLFELISDDGDEEARLLNLFRVMSHDGKEEALRIMYSLSQEYWYERAQ